MYFILGDGFKSSWDFLLKVMLDQSRFSSKNGWKFYVCMLSADEATCIHKFNQNVFYLPHAQLGNMQKKVDGLKCSEK